MLLYRSSDGLQGGLGISKLKFSIKKRSEKNLSAVFLQFLAIKTRDPDPDPDPLDMLDPDRNSMNLDPQHLFAYCLLCLLTYDYQYCIP